MSDRGGEVVMRLIDRAKSPPLHRTALLAAAALLALAAAPLAGRAQPASVPRILAGTWVAEGGPTRAMRTVEAAFAPSIATFPSLFQGIARDRIRTSMEPPRRVLVSLDGARVRVTLESANTTVVAGPLRAPATTSGIQEGTRVTPRLQGGWLELLYQGEGSELRQLFSTEADGSRMHLDFTVTSPQLPAPVRYRLDYVRP
jgi:hypothetical protein